MTHLFEFARVRNWVIEAGAIALKYYQTQLLKHQKSDHSPVTEADRVVENFLLDRIQQASSAYDYDIIAEESVGNWQNKEFLWAVDPIDGTRVFINGVPLWCISIGLLKNGEPYRGVVYLPVTNDIYYTDDNGHPFWNRRPLKGLLATTWDNDSFIAVPSGAHRYFDIQFRRLRALGAVATHHVFVASGVSVAALHRKVNVWDIAGAHAILSAAGGQAVYLDGAPLSLSQVLSRGQTMCQGPILAGHPMVLENLIQLIKPYQTPVSVGKDG